MFRLRKLKVSVCLINIGGNWIYFVAIESFSTLGSKKQRQSPKKDGEKKAVRRSHRESRKVFESLNEHTLVRGLVGDYLHPNAEQDGGSGKKRRALLEEIETDSQGEVSCVFCANPRVFTWNYSLFIKIIFRNRYSNFPPNLWETV
jgi:hypothetical protein